MFDNKVFNRLEIDDYIEGNISDRMLIKLADIKVMKCEEYNENNRTMLFEGLFAEMIFDKPLDNYLVIRGNGLKYIQTDYMDINNQEFDKYFNVFTDNKEFAEKILTEEIMSMLVDYREKYDLHFDIALRGERLCIRFFTGSMFEPSILGNPLNKNLLLIYYCVLQFSIDLTQKVNFAIRKILN